MKAKRECFAVWDVEIYAQLIEGYGRGGVRVGVETGKKGSLSMFRKSLCCYINMSLDSVISHGKYNPIHCCLAFESHRTGNRNVNNFIYSMLSVRHMLCRCLNPFRMSDVIESFTDLSETM